MKKINILYIIVFLTNIGSMVGQDETVYIDFEEATPIWVHTAVDSTFEEIPGQTYWTKYSSLLVEKIKRQGDDLFILSGSNEAGSIPDHWGFVLDKIDLHTGETIWKHHNTINNGGNQDYYQQMQIQNDGNIELVGVERYKNEGGTLNWSLGGYSSNAIRKIINIENGNLIQSYHAVDSLNEIYLPCRHFKIYDLIYDSLYLSATMIGDDVGEIGNPDFNYGITFQLLDKHMNQVEKTRNLFNFDSLGPFSIDQPSLQVRLDKGNLISLAYKDRYESWENLGLKMMWSDISDPRNIHTKQILDLTSLVPGTKQTFLDHRFRTFNSTIFLGHVYPNFEIQENSAYILWLDSIGNLKAFIDLPRYEDHLYLATDMIYANDDFAYLFAYPSSTGRNGFDIIKI